MNFWVVACSTVLQNQVQEEVFQIQLVDFISLPGSSLRTSNGDFTFPGILSFLYFASSHLSSHRNRAVATVNFK
jgi:hypothetical protein